MGILLSGNSSQGNGIIRHFQLFAGDIGAIRLASILPFPAIRGKGCLAFCNEVSENQSVIPSRNQDAFYFVILLR